MKKIILSLTLAVTAIGFSHAQSAKYAPAMEKNIAIMDTAQSPETYLALAGNFERIGNAEKTQWLPFYYAGLANGLYAFMDPKADKDALGIKALELAAKADAIQKSDETAAVYYMGYIAQLMVDPMTRYMEIGPKANKALEDGLKTNPQNPRLYYLKGQGLLNTPEFAGGGKAAAKPVLEKAVALFATDKPQPLYPHWGKEIAQQALDKCK